MSKPYGIHWFRRDLRIEDNPALSWNWKENQGRVIGFFCFDKKFLSRPDFSVNRFQFFIETLKDLKSQLIERGGELWVMDEGPFDAFPKLLKALPTPSVISWNRDYEPFARERDNKMEFWCKDRGISFHTERDHLLIEPHELLKGYQVFTPFSRKWLELYRSEEVRKRVSFRWKGGAFQSLKIPQNRILESYDEQNRKRVTIPIPEAGCLAAKKALTGFSKQIANYEKKRDFPSINGTSHFSIFFKNGSLTVPRVCDAYELKKGKFLTELIWREFYYHILHRNPEVETSTYRTKYNALKWEDREDWFEKWKVGMTGFPIVDAGMRQLKQTGWMHNRVRMIVASFLTKDLGIDWRWGERYFMEQLLDGDLAPNNGGWQWAASTGCDPQPYFRIFNPSLQSKKFDPNGDYIREYIPELKGLKNREIHDPPLPLRKHYPSPMVDRHERRILALQRYRHCEELAKRATR